MNTVLLIAFLALTGAACAARTRIVVEQTDDGMECLRQSHQSWRDCQSNSKFNRDCHEEYERRVMACPGAKRIPDDS